MTDLINKDLDVTIISSFTAAADIGIYKMAKNLALLVWKVIDPFTLALVPEISRLVSTGQRARVRLLIARSSVGLFVIALLLSLGILSSLWLFGAAIFGPAFVRLPSLLPYMLAAITFGASLVWGHPLAVALNRADLSLVGALIGSVLGITLLLALAPGRGIVIVSIIWGSAFATSFLYMGIMPLILLRQNRS